MVRESAEKRINTTLVHGETIEIKASKATFYQGKTIRKTWVIFDFFKEKCFKVPLIAENTELILYQTQKPDPFLISNTVLPQLN